MGMIMDPTPEMGEYRVEIRRTSFYLRGEGNGAHRGTIIVYPDTDDPVPTGTVEILIEDIPKIRAALDQVESINQHKDGSQADPRLTLIVTFHVEPSSHMNKHPRGR